MKKIFNWTVGSFFRTIGRTIAFLLLGALMVYLGHRSGIKISDIIGITRVSAAENVISWTTQQVRIQTTRDGNYSWTTFRNINGNNSYVFSSSDITNPISAMALKLVSPNGFTFGNTYTFEFAYKSTPDNLVVTSIGFYNGSTDEQEEPACTSTRNDNGWYWYTCSFSPKSDYSSSTHLYVRLGYNISYVTDYRVSVRGFVERKGIESAIIDSTNQIIINNNNNTQITVDSINNLTDSITDDDVSSGVSSASDLFSDFTTDNHGLTAVVQAPLNFIRTLTSSTCSVIRLPLPF